MSAKAVLVFDWDGTLVDSLEHKIANAARLFNDVFDVSRTAVDEAYRRHTGIPRRQLFEAIAADVGAPLLTEELFRELSEQFTRANQTAISRIAPPADTVETLQALTVRQYPLYISSSAAPDELRQLSKQLKLDGYFAEILGSTPGFDKGPEHIDYIRSRQNDPTTLLFIGDDPADVQLGRQSGALTVAKIGTHPAERLQASQPDYLIRRLAELIPLLDNLLHK